MNYRHLYHAGSYMDVVKHVTLTALITALYRKDTPICYLDTHAGIGCYDLFSDSANKTKEFENGIEKIIRQDNPPPLVQRFLDCVHQYNNRLTASQYASLRYYPGSPMVARLLLRPQDRIVACELHPEDYQTLRTTFAGDKQVSTHHTNGFTGLKAFLPPKERRGLVLIDPPYENPDEFSQITHSLVSALKRWESGIYAIWYPIKEKSQLQRFYQSLKTRIKQPIFVIELTIYPDLPQHLNGCGLAVVNPPWQFDEAMNQVLPWLWNALTINGQGAFRTAFLK